jgi:hypothetical protein
MSKPAEPPPEVTDPNDVPAGYCSAPEVPDDDGLLHDRPIAPERGRPVKSVKVPKVPAGPDEVFVIVNGENAPYDVYGDRTNADECVSLCGGTVVRYVRSPKR